MNKKATLSHVILARDNPFQHGARDPSVSPEPSRHFFRRLRREAARTEGEWDSRRFGGSRKARQRNRPFMRDPGAQHRPLSAFGLASWAMRRRRGAANRPVCWRHPEGAARARVGRSEAAFRVAGRGRKSHRGIEGQGLGGNLDAGRLERRPGTGLRDDRGGMIASESPSKMEAWP